MPCQITLGLGFRALAGLSNVDYATVLTHRFGRRCGGGYRLTRASYGSVADVQEFWKLPF